MEKKESLNKEGWLKDKTFDVSNKTGGLSNKAFGIIKFILGICLLPLVYSSSAAFLSEFNLIEKSLQNYFWLGAISLLILYLFIWEPTIIYIKGQRILEVVFSFFRPLVKLAPYLLPIFTIIIYIIYGLLSLIIKSPWLIEYSMFLFGFTIVLHIIFSAKSIRSKKSDFLKANYIFGFSLVYIINLALLAFFLNLISKQFSFVNFSNNSLFVAKNIFYAIFKQLFLKG